MIRQITKMLLFAASVVAMVTLPAEASYAYFASRPMFTHVPAFKPRPTFTSPGVPKPTYRPPPIMPRVTFPGPAIPRHR
jgi:hypothetical protein